jgi:Na+/melibiose symporter-like transporter
MKIPLIIASDFGSIGIVRMIAWAFWICLPLSFFSLILVLPKKIRKHTKWIASVASAASFLAFILMIYLMLLLNERIDPDWLFIIGIGFLSLFLSGIALFISRRKNQNENGA